MDELLERGAVLAQLAAAAAAARAGQGGVVLLSGEAGVGKSSVVQRFAGTLGPAGVLSGLCDPLSTPRPLGPLLDFAADLAPELPER
ncbi:MAG: AAA family ATPase, partial [Micromonosporaceae bacterium]|nr:AAA family ATPase [Micromonosporaceae bacterium]